MQEKIALLQEEVPTQSTLPSPPAPLDTVHHQPREMFTFRPQQS